MPMTITVVPITEPELNPGAPLSKVMNERLRRLAAELQNQHLKALKRTGFNCEDLVIYISYNNKYNIRWKIVNDVPVAIEREVAEQCAQLGYILWKGSPVYNFKN